MFKRLLNWLRMKPHVPTPCERIRHALEIYGASDDLIDQACHRADRWLMPNVGRPMDNREYVDGVVRRCVAWGHAEHRKRNLV